MRFYDPSTDPATRFDSKERFPQLRDEAAARECLALGCLPSVTTVLKVIREPYLERWLIKEGIREYTDNGNDADAAVNTVCTRQSPQAAFGTDCHALMEHWFGSPEPEVSEQVKAHTEPLLRWLDENVREPVFSELILADKELGVAGAVDCGIILKDGRRVVADLKVVKYSKKYPPTPNLNYRCQLSAYARMLANHYGETFERMTIFLASPFGYDKEPAILMHEHHECYHDTFKAARLLWEQQVRLG